MAIFKIPSVNMMFLNEVLEKLNRRAKKLSCPEITTKVLAVYPAVYDEDGQLKEYAHYEVEVDGFAPVIPGWTFLGTVEHTEFGNILRSIPGQEIPESYRNAPKKCDHCKTIRNRKDTYMVKTDAGEVKQVGHNCVRDYLGHVSPEQLAFAAQWISEFERLTGEFSGGSGRIYGVEVFEFLGVVAEMTLREGYRGGQHPKGGTCRAAYSNITNRNDLIKQGRRDEIVLPTKRADELAQAALAWHEEMPDDSNYARNMKIAIKKATQEHAVVSSRDCGLVGSVIQAYRKAMDLVETKKNTPKPVSEFVGEIGKRYDFEALKLNRKLSYKQQFSTFYVLIFTDSKGNVFKWLTGNGFDLYEGESYNLRGAVKAFEVYRDTKQTVITRCTSVQHIPGEVANGSQETSQIQAN